MSRSLILLGSASSSGRTAAAAERVRALAGGTTGLIDLRSRAIEPFAYGRRDRRDDFEGVVAEMLRHERIVFASPVYWYAMSGVMKTFFDRLTDLLRPELKSLADGLAGRDVWLLATGTDEAMPAGFSEPFARTAHYFGMRWREAFYVRVGRSAGAAALEMPEADKLARRLAEARS